MLRRISLRNLQWFPHYMQQGELTGMPRNVLAASFWLPQGSQSKMVAPGKDATMKEGCCELGKFGNYLT